jgi:glycosyltransferase involved in cell wall biosynthesis
MKILQLTNKPPVPSVDGGCLAMCQITNLLLSEGNVVKVVSVTTKKHPIVQSEDFDKYSESTQFDSVFIDTKPRLFKAFKSLIKGTSLQADRFFSEDMVNKLKSILLQEKFDVVILESIFVGGYIETIKKYSNARIILRAHNVEYLIWKRLLKQEKNPVKKIVYYYLSNSLKRFELSLFNKIDGYLPLTEVDQKFFTKQFPNLSSQVVPFGIDLSLYPYKPRKINEKKITLFHLGSMNWRPNIEGMNWFLENIWKKIIEKQQTLTLVIAGKGNQTIFADCALENVEIFDFVEDAQQFMNAHDIMIVPLLSGSGMRIKIMEGLALGKPVITTTIGAEGIDITDKENILIADTPEAMMQVIDFCINNIEKCEEIGRNARKLIENEYATQKNIFSHLIF